VGQPEGAVETKYYRANTASYKHVCMTLVSTYTSRNRILKTYNMLGSGRACNIGILETDFMSFK